MGLNSSTVHFTNELPRMVIIMNKLREVTELEINLEDYLEDEEGELGNAFSIEPAHYVGIVHQITGDERSVLLCTTDFGATYLFGSVKFVLTFLGGTLGEPLPLWAGLPWHQAKDHFHQKSD